MTVTPQMDLLSVLVDLDPVFNQADPRESELRNQLKSIVVTMNEFGMPRIYCIVHLLMVT
jgi:hypothetical protein